MKLELSLKKKLYWLCHLWGMGKSTYDRGRAGEWACLHPGWNSGSSDCWEL